MPDIATKHHLEFEVEVEGGYQPHEPEVRYYRDGTGSPEVPEEAEVTGVHLLLNGKRVYKLPAELWDEYEEELEDALIDQARDDAEAAEEAKYDRWKDEQERLP